MQCFKHPTSSVEQAAGIGQPTEMPVLITKLDVFPDRVSLPFPSGNAGPQHREALTQPLKGPFTEGEGEEKGEGQGELLPWVWGFLLTSVAPAPSTTLRGSLPAGQRPWEPHPLLTGFRIPPSSHPHIK